MLDSSRESQIFTVDPKFMDQFSSEAPLPGGGSLIAFTCGAAAALVSKIAKITVNKEDREDTRDKLDFIISKADHLRQRLVEASKQDNEVYAAFLRAKHLPKNTYKQQLVQAEAVNKAVNEIINVPLSVCSMAVQVLKLAHFLASTAYIKTIADTACAAYLAASTVRVSIINIQINLGHCTDQETIEDIQNKINALKTEAGEIEMSLDNLLLTRGEISNYSVLRKSQYINL